MRKIEGYIKLYRQTLENPIVCKDAEHFAVWCYLLLNATHSEIEKVFKGKKIILQKGQLITGRGSISVNIKIAESKVQRILKTFEIEHQIEQQTSNKNRLITVLNWELYQSSEQQKEQQLNNKRTTTEQQSEHKQECIYKNDKNVKNDNNINSPAEQNNISKLPYKEIINYLNDKIGTSYKSSSKANQKLISARLNEGNSLDDFKKVIDKKVAEWEKTDMSKYLRPSTLFGTKFEGYLNQKGSENIANHTGNSKPKTVTYGTLL